MKKLWRNWSGPVALFISGIDFERVTNGGTEAYFGTHWLLIFFMIVLFAFGVSRIHISVTPPDDRGLSVPHSERGTSREGER